MRAKLIEVSAQALSTVREKSKIIESAYTLERKQKKTLNSLVLRKMVELLQILCTNFEFRKTSTQFGHEWTF